MADLTCLLARIPETWPAGLRIIEPAMRSIRILDRPLMPHDYRRPHMGSWCRLDLSAPDCDRHGRPLWLDPLPWAMAVLVARHDPEIRPDAYVPTVTLRRDALAIRDHHLDPLLVLAASGEAWQLPCSGPKCVVPNWPASSGLAHDTAARAIVAAALRARVGLEVTHG